MKRLLLISLVLFMLPAVYGYYQVNGRMMGEVIKWLAGDEIQVDLSGPRPPENPDILERGQDVFDTHCALCHGDRGDGKSIRSVDMQVKPGDFTTGNYRYRSTPAGSLPTDEDIYTTINRGIRGTGMLPWFGLSSEEKWAVTYFLKTLSGRFKEEGPAEPVVVPYIPAVTPDLALQGKELFRAEGCSDCHGMEGKGDGPLAGDLKDDRGIPIELRNFATDPLKRGSGIEEIYLSITIGIDGTPMASYADDLIDEEIIAIAVYLNSLATEHPRERGGMFEPVPITADEHAGMMMTYPAMPVGLMRYGMLKLYEEPEAKE